MTLVSTLGHILKTAGKDHPFVKEYADLYCGGGGLSLGFYLALEAQGIPVSDIRLIAINHWAAAIATHKANLPWAEHYCADVEALNPLKLVPSGRLEALSAAPKCTHHSVARGGKPRLEQQRADAYSVLRWTDRLYIPRVLIENVPEFQSWGPLGSDGQPLKSKKGESFRGFIHTFERQDYTVSYRVLNAADYGAATNRKRLFILARRGHHIIHWPAPTHSNPKAKGGLVPGTKPWRAAREVIDWSIRGQSIRNRKKPLAPATMKRIWYGIEKFCKDEFRPFLVVLRGTTEAHLAASAHAVEDPVPTLAANGNHMGIAEPFVLAMGSNGAPRSVDDPLPTIVTAGGGSLVEPFILPPEGYHRGNVARSVEDPMPTITQRGDEIGLVQPFLARDPLPTADTSNRYALVQPFILPPAGYHQEGGNHNVPRSVDDPLQTITQRGGGHLVEPILIEYYGNGTARSVEEPIPTLTTKDRLALVDPRLTKLPEGWTFDILFRMLRPHELAGAMGFHAGYKFSGTRGDVVKQIGNAVEVNVAKALWSSLLRDEPVDVEDVNT